MTKLAKLLKIQKATNSKVKFMLKKAMKCNKNKNLFTNPSKILLRLLKNIKIKT